MIILVLLAYHAVATGYVAGTASHTTLYADTIRGKAGATVTVDDSLTISNGGLTTNQKSDMRTAAAEPSISASGQPALEGLYTPSPGRMGTVGSLNYGVYGQYAAGGNYGLLGGSNSGVYGYNAGGNYGYFGGASFGAYGRNSNSNYGYFGGASYGGFASHAATGNYVRLATDTYGIDTNSGIRVGAAATCTDANGPLACALNDVAEDIYSKEELGDGDVVSIDTENDEHVRLSNKPYDTAVAGIISSTPAFHISTSNTGIPLALAGRVKAKASSENGPIRRGDLLTTSSTKGHLMRCESREKCFGSLIGKALEPLDRGKGKIMVLVTLG